MPRTSRSQKVETSKQVAKDSHSKAVAVRWRSNVEMSESESSRGTSKSILKKKTKNTRPIRRDTKRLSHDQERYKSASTNDLVMNNIERSEKSTIPDSNYLIGKTQFISSPRAVVVDTRTLQTFEGDAAGTSFINTVLKFFQMCARRGALPRYLATPHASTNAGKHSSRRITVEARACTLDALINEGGTKLMSDTWKSVLVPVRVRSTDSNVPRSLSACASWRLFGDLVDTIVNTAKASINSDVSPKCMDPIEVVILTSDVALFTDLHKDNHSKASQGFWERVQNHFASKVIDSIQIYVLDSRAREGIPLGICDANENSIRLMISDISCTLRNTFVTNYTSTGSGMLDMKVVDSSLVILSKLLRQWLRKLIGGSHIEFELPETIDGSVCSIALDLEYKLLPYSLVSHEVQHMIAEANILTTLNKIEVVKVIPVQSIDASLMFGIPMIAKVGCESDAIRYLEMRKVVRQLWKWLSINDSALLLCVQKSCAEGDTFTQHYYLLLTDSPAYSEDNEHTHPKSINGVIFRYAIGDQILYDENNDEYREDLFNFDESDEQYFEYIERSMEYVDQHDQQSIFSPFSLDPIGNKWNKAKTIASKIENVENVNSQDDFDAKGEISNQVEDRNKQCVLSADDFVFDYN